MIVEKSSGAVVFRHFNNDIEFLIVKSKENGHWGFPKGHVEKNESLKETALREVIEETGLHVKLIDNFNCNIEYQISKNLKKEVIFFIGLSKDEEVSIQESEIKEFKWGNYESISNTLTFENAKNVLLDAKKIINKDLVKYM